MSTARSIEILGPGCARCKETYRIVRAAVEPAGLDREVIKNESIERMADLGLDGHARRGQLRQSRSVGPHPESRQSPAAARDRIDPALAR